MATAGSLVVSMPPHGAADHVPTSAGSTPLLRGVNAAHSSPGSDDSGVLPSVAALEASAAAIATGDDTLCASP
eukprot:scaffold45530_cov68-Phaeocystis_antarctica.AAC.6